MILDKINELVESINDALIQPSNFPSVRREGNTVGFIKRKEDEHWMSQDVFEKTILKLSRCSESHDLIVAEDFERVYKSSGKTVRLNDIVCSNWQDVSHFFANNEMISFYVFDYSLSWCSWFNDSYWCLVFDNSNRDAIEASYLNVELAFQAFPQADSQFKSFINSLYEK
ncbi:hypothetical protein GCM10008107_04900 [Psychrosphaera saromensis]|uniref:Uncharacterized protein n=1 Tax=Psychrosphaera saromensis TaxID=716813 RepID=A0A2S7UX47_9GAMM|nr:hypothetical protein [Psychrosphaera saromensis]PQJ54574.1 hypothetical protein BTO11_13575 [Psychrosphaera saromensis]GHB58845.1 hypothetical protein GCM10008107_04900 [Psychrosphaera saromensis]GLQ14211.1 hypothetical protein GCM10007917_16660 [Psychrosphaera saromensis]